MVARNRSDVGIFKRDNLWPCAKRFVKLVRADVDGVNASRATIQKDLRKPTGRCPDIKANSVLGVETEWSSAAASLMPPRET